MLTGSDPMPGHVFSGINVSSHASAIFGDLIQSCPEYMKFLALENQRKAMLSALYYHSMHNRASQVVTADSKTCEYIWDSPFASWLRDTQTDSMFWISGKPGSGKSTLMKYLAECDHGKKVLAGTCSDVERWVVLHFFFDFRAAKELANTTDGLFRSILYQVICSLQFSPELLEKYSLDMNNVLRSQMVSGILDLTARLLQYQKLKVLLLVDGLDEYEGDMRQLIQCIKMFHMRGGIRVCLASRPEPMITMLLQDCPSIRLQDMNRRGIHAFIGNAFRQLSSNFDIDLQSKDSLAEHLQAQAQGVFLWVRFATERLLEALVMGCTIEEARDAIETLPSDLKQMYQKIIDGIPQICKAEAALVLRVLEDWSGAMPLETLHRLWLLLRPKLHNKRPCEQSIDLKHYEIRLQGFLGGLVDVRLVKVYTDDSEEANSTATAVEDYRMALHAFAYRGVVSLYRTRTSSSFRPSRDILEVRLLHETLRPFLKENRERITSYLPGSIQCEYPDKIWHRALIGAAQSHSISSFRDVVELVLEETKSSHLRLAATDMNGPKRIVLLEKARRALSPLNPSATKLSSEVSFMADATQHIRRTFTENDSLGEKLFDKLAHAISSPVFLLRHLPETDLIDLVSRECASAPGPTWRFDIILALVFRETSWLRRCQRETVLLPTAQKQWMMQRMVEKRITDHKVQNWEDFELAVELFFLFVQDGKVTSTTLASHLMMCDRYTDYGNLFVSRYAELRPILCARVDSPLVTEDLMDAQHFEYIGDSDSRKEMSAKALSNNTFVRQGKHLLEVWHQLHLAQQDDAECANCELASLKQGRCERRPRVLAYHKKRLMLSLKKGSLNETERARRLVKINEIEQELKNERKAEDHSQTQTETLQKVDEWQQDVGSKCSATCLDLLMMLGVDLKSYLHDSGGNLIHLVLQEETADLLRGGHTPDAARIKLLKFVIEQGVDLSHVNNEGESAWQVAQRSLRNARDVLVPSSPTPVQMVLCDQCRDRHQVLVDQLERRLNFSDQGQGT